MVDCIGLFSGAGGLDIGAKQAGARVIRCVEIDDDSVATLRANFPDLRVDHGDIASLSFLEHQSARGPKIIIGGPPCQPFSKNGYWVKNENRLIEHDPRNMLSEFLRAVEEAKPTGFLFENVESLLHPTNKHVVEAFLEMAAALGYRCTLYRANSADYGVPQKRKRVFIFGVRKYGRAAPPAPKPTHSATPELDGLKPYEGVKKFIKGFDTKKYFEPSEITTAGTYAHELAHVPPGRNYMALAHLEGYTGRTFRAGGRFWNFLQKLHPDEPSITIAAQPGPWVGPFHWSSRRLRVPEIAGIQTFPKDYKFVGKRRSVQKQIGNAVPCLLGEAMVRHLIESL
ncbi:DNA cytosine methyltransferase [Sphingomonas sp. DC1100-1]|uniref:DNA cytosine methyltransferase n=1 Tax=unclassified Sphingomonas TaxID=196159 RepID=UPI003CF633E6